MRALSAATIAIFLACAACQSPPGKTQLAELPGTTSPPPACRGFATPVTAAGKPEQAVGEACKQPDGSWRVVQNTPGLPAQTYVTPPSGRPPAAASTAAQAPSDRPPCTSYTASVTVGGQERQAVIEACPQPDGGWTITQNTPGLPVQTYQVPPPASSPYPYASPYPADYLYPEFFPYWVGTPWFFGLAPSIVVVQKFHQFPHGFSHGFGHGFGRGFGRGFAGGFGHGFGAARGGGRR